MKDPAFLFYSSDFLSGTMLMTNEDVGKYIKLLCLQHQKGHLKEKEMLSICGNYNEDIFNKFKKDEEGNYYNERLEYEANKRKAYSESRRNNRKKKETYEEDMKNICNSYEEHMGTETETETITTTINNNINNEEKLQKRFIECIGSTNLNAIEGCISYLEDLPYEVIDKALTKTSGVSKPNWNYAKKILDDWVSRKINTLEKVEAEELAFRNKDKPPEETPEEKIQRRVKEIQELERRQNGTG